MMQLRTAQLSCVLLLAAAFVSPLPGRAATDIDLAMVADLDTTAGGGDSAPARFRTYGGQVYFMATTPLRGTELYATDGVSADARLVHEFAPGPASSYPAALGLAGGKLIVEADDGAGQGARLFALDQATGQSIPLLDFGYPGSPHYVAAQPVAQAGTSVLFERDAVLWTTDGTPAGTQPLLEGSDGLGLAARTCPIAGGALFVAPSPAAQSTIWRTDGTRAGTVILKALPQAQGLVDLSSDAGRCFFLFRGEDFSWSLWRSDGGAATLVRQRTDALPVRVSSAGGVPYVTDENGITQRFRLWRGNVSLPVVDYPMPYNGRPAPFLKAVGSRAVFEGPYMQNGTPKTGLFVSDGSTAGTRRVTVPEGTSYAFDIYKKMVVVGNSLLVPGLSMSKVDVISGEYTRIPGLFSFNLYDFAVLGDAFIGGDYDEFSGEVWRMEADGSGRRRLHDIWQANAGGVLAEGRSASIGDTLFFDHGRELGAVNFETRALWRSDGTAAGTQMLQRSLYGEGRVLDFAPVGDELVFAIWPPQSGTRYFRTARDFGRADVIIDEAGYDTLQPIGNGAGALLSCMTADFPSYPRDSLCALRAGETTASVVAPNFESFASWILPIGSVGNVALFYAQETSMNADAGLWRSDGTAAGTYRLVTGMRMHSSDPNQSRPSQAFNGELLFDGCRAPGIDCGLYASDGSAAGTRFIAPLPARIKYLGRAGERVVLITDSYPSQLWATDATAAGTGLLRDVGYSVQTPVQVGARAHFIASQGSEGFYYVSDGTAAGTTTVAMPQSVAASYSEIVAVDDTTALFSCQSQAFGVELCRIDSAGTEVALLRDIHPGPGHSSPRFIGRTSSAHYYSADDGYHGRELWRITPRRDGIFASGFQLP